MELDKLKLKCECNGQMEKTQTIWKGIEVRGWRCNKCNEELIHPADAQKALEIDKARKSNELTVKLRKVGKSSVVTVPQVIMETEGLKNGQFLKWNLEGKKIVLDQIIG